MAMGPRPSTWSKVLGEIKAVGPQPAGGPSGFDIVLHKKLAGVHALTKRPLVLYATACTVPNRIIPPQMLMIDFSDKLAFADATEMLDGSAIDIIIHSPGGIAEAVESVVSQLRRRFSDIRFIVPDFAKSAATMMVMSGNEILMDPDAELGPIDPQMHTIFGTHPAQSIIEQYEEGKNKIFEDNRNVPVWGPILANLAPSLLVDCRHAIALSEKLVEEWLQKYMFANDPHADLKAREIVGFLSNHAYFKSHARRVTLDDLTRLRTKVKDLSADQQLHAAVKEAYCATDITLGNTATVRLIENHLGNRVVRSFAQPPLTFQLQRRRVGGPPGPPPSAP